MSVTQPRGRVICPVVEMLCVAMVCERFSWQFGSHSGLSMIEPWGAWVNQDEKQGNGRFPDKGGKRWKGELV